MKLSSPLLSFLVNFLLGASWAFAFAGATIFFYLFLEVNLLYAIFGAFIGALPGLFFVLLIEYFLMKNEQLVELKKQTKLLEELVSKS
ncbi:MAG: Unknown protein [uncultured Sulfurovum sp.]|uniref:Uncharacterized protein n=1 Tax=uncultured Sulfurovum sp. TaxID=269237 RepID=A0A6S6ST46_9BACT|nr:MAG: Unknown protein [uncultured Sulfurovum sp.]